MRVILCKDYEEMSHQGAKLIASLVTLKPESVIGFATGSTPVGLYRELIRMYNEKDVDFSQATGFNLDEYYPIAHDNPQSYHYFMKEQLFDHINIKKGYIPNGSAENAELECACYEKKIAEHGGIDLQILGIGQNGHIGFNEPDAKLCAVTHVTKLTDSTIAANSRFFDDIADVPTHALTMGIATILKSKKIVLLANGKSKHAVIKELLTDDITTSIPATLLKTHPDVVLIVDEEAYNG